MLGAIIGDVVGSRFERDNFKSKDFELFNDECSFTDDSVMTIAIGKAIIECHCDYSNLEQQAIYYMRLIGRKYPNVGYGGNFSYWLMHDDEGPYGSYGNGAAMRVSACGFAAKSLKEAEELALAVTRVTHNHCEGLKASKAISCAIYLLRNGSSKDEAKKYLSKYYDLDFTLNEIRPNYHFDVSCQGSVPQAIVAFLESNDFEDAIRNAISIGGDSDTIGAITGGLAEAYYGIPEIIKNKSEVI